MQDLTDAWEIGAAEVDDVLGIGDVVVLVGRIHYRGKGSGVDSTSPAGWMLKFRDGKLCASAPSESQCERASSAP
jgi:hypothetical protein